MDQSSPHEVAHPPGPVTAYREGMTTETMNPETLHRIPTRLDVDAAVPAFSRAMSRLDGSATQELDRVGFPQGLRDLVRLRASQINGCAYCVDTHSADAATAGESAQRDQRRRGLERVAVLHRARAGRPALHRGRHPGRRHPGPPGGVRRGRGALVARRGRRAAGADRGDQRLERDRRRHPRLGAGPGRRILTSVRLWVGPTLPAWTSTSRSTAPATEPRGST